MADQINYGYRELFGIPPEMAAWGMSLQLPYPSEFGGYALVEVEPADIELHHQVEIIDESGDPLRGVWVIFGFPGDGPDINLYPRENHWRSAPSVLKGNAQKTNAAGYAQHTFKTGGEDIWIWDVGTAGVLKLTSTIVKGCKWVGPPAGQFLHTGVKLRFQRREAGVVPRQLRLEALEARVAALEAKLGGQ